MRWTLLFLPLLLLVLIPLPTPLSSAAPPGTPDFEFVGPLLMGGTSVPPHSVAIQFITASCPSDYVLAGWNSDAPFPAGISPSLVAYHHNATCMTAEMRLTNPTDAEIAVPNRLIRFLIAKP